MLTFLLEAALRSLLMATLVWVGLRLCRVTSPLDRKSAWILVLVSAALMPIVMHNPLVTSNRRIPAIELPLRGTLEKVANRAATGAPRMGQAAESQIAQPAPVLIKPKPSPVPSRVHLDYPLAHSIPAPYLSSIPAKPSSPAAAAITVQTSFRTSLRTALWAAYFSVMILLLLRAAIGTAIAFRVWHRAKPVDLGSTALFVAGDPNSSLPRIRVTTDLLTPVTIGSTILLPAGFPSWPAAKLRAVLAHEHSHIRQRDFYLQLAAALHSAIFWFSPLGWWLKDTLTDLGETLGDRAGLAQSSDPTAYARILLEFAALPRPRLPWMPTITRFQPTPGVPMARTSSLSTRIERILSERRPSRSNPPRVETSAHRSPRLGVFLAAAFVPVALAATVAFLRFAPPVEAAQHNDAYIASHALAQSAPPAPPAPATSLESAPSAAPAPTPVPAAPASDLAGPPAPAGPLTPAQPAAPSKAALAAEPPSPDAPPAPEASEDWNQNESFSFHNSDGDDSWAIFRGSEDHVRIDSRHSLDIEKARQKVKGDFIWFEHDGKSYVITDPKILAQSSDLLKPDPTFTLRQREFDQEQKKLNAEMNRLAPEIAKAAIPGPEFTEQMSKLNAELAELKTDKIQKEIQQVTKELQENKHIDQKELQEQVQKLTQEKLADLQEKIGDIQGRIGEIQGQIGERQGLMGERQGEIGERMGALGERMGRLGEEQGRKAEEASRKVRSLLDQAIKDGKAKPVN